MPAPVFRSSHWLAAALACAAASTAGAAPTVANDSYSVNVNASLSVPVGSGLLANDTGFNATTHRLESSDEFSQFGGRVIVAADGSFSYQPVPGFRGVDSFQYTVRDATGASTALVSIDVSGETVWFVDDSAPAGGNGTRSAPFNSFAPLNGASGVGDMDANGDTIFVFAGTYDVTFDLEPGQKLFGEAAGLDLVGTANDVPPGTRPLISSGNSFPLIELFGAGGRVREFNIANSGGKAISGNGAGGFTLEGIGIASAAGASGAIEFINSAGVITIQGVAITGATQATGSALSFLNNAAAVSLFGTTVSAFTGGYVLNVSDNSGTITFDSASDLSSSNTRGLAITTQGAAGTVTLAGVDLNGGAASEPLIRLQGNNATSRVIFAEGVLADATTTDTQAFSSDGGQLRIDGTNSVLTSTDGPALYLENVNLVANATFTTLSSTSSNARGISVDSPVGNNDVIVTGTTTISSPTTEAIRVNSASASGFLLQLATLTSTGGTVGISLTNAALTVSNNTSAITTSAGPAVVCTGGTANLALATLTAAGGSNGVSFDGCAGTVTAAAGTLNSTAGASNAVVNLVNGAGTNALNFTYGGTINKANAGPAVNIVGLANPGTATFNGPVTGSNASGGVVINNNARNVTFTNLNLGTAGARFATTPVALGGNTGRVNLGNVAIYTNAATALNINYANASPGRVTTETGSLLDVTGNATALVVNHATLHEVVLTFATITSTGAGTHGINLNRTSGLLLVETLVNLGAKTTAGVEIANSSISANIQELDINGALDGVRLSNNTGDFTIMGDLNFVNVHSNGLGGTFTNIVNNAFDLTNIQDFRATDVIVNGTGGHGVTGTGITGTNNIFSNVDFNNIGNADNEHVFNFREGAVSGAQVSGTLDINNSIIQNFTDNGLYLENFSGNLDFRWTNMTLRNNITTTACGGGNCNGNGILLRADGTARINAFIQNAVFEDIDGIALTANPEGNSGARMDLAVVSSAFTAETYAGPSNTNNGEVAISLRNAQGNSTLNFRLFSNDIRNYTGEFALGIVEIEGGDFTTTNGVVSDLYIYNAHEGDAVGIFSDGANTGGSGTTNYDLILSFNNVRTPGGTAGSSFYFSGNGAISGSDANAQITLTNSQFPISPTKAFWRTVDLTFDSGSANFNRACFDIRNNQVAAGSSGLPAIDLYYISSTILRLEGMSGTGDVNAQNYLNANNTLGISSSVGVLNNITSATCTDPTLPAAFPFN